MKSSASTQRITLFPFLAVLICIMGALLVLLIVISKRAQATAQTQQQERAHAVEVEQAQKERALAVEAANLEKLRDQIATRLAESRHTLAHIEDHMRRLGEEIRRLQAVAAKLDDNPEQGNHDMDALKEKLAKLQQEKGETQSLIDELNAAQPEKPSYRIIPYHGNSSTQRRPIYLECREDGVYFQPEGIHLNHDDFARPLGPENPLAAGVRAQSSFLNQHRSSRTHPIDPYPLLVVRPSGISAYYAARIAIRSWESDFGYELVDEDISLDFGTPDPSIARVTQEAIDIARPRHQFMVARAERIQLQGAHPSIVRNANGRGRMVGSGQGDDGRGDAAGRGHGRTDELDTAWDDTRRHGTDIDRNRGALRRAAEAHKLAAEKATKNTGDDPSGNALKPALGRSGQSSPEGSASSTPSAGGPSGSPQTDQANSVSLQFGDSSQPSSQAHTPISDVRGDNWALPGASSGSVPFERPMRVEIYSNQITLYHSDPRRQPLKIPFESDTRHTIERFVSAIWEHMESWGIAGRGMYWRPMLNVYVDPEARWRAEELKQLLDRSGLEIKYIPVSGKSN